MTAITEFVDLDRHGRVAVLTVNHPPVNALNHGVRQGLKEWVVAALGDAAISAIVITCAGQTFIAGSDIAEFTKPPQAPGLKALRDRMLEYQEQLGGDHWTARRAPEPAR